MAGQRCKDAGYVGCLVLHRAPGNPKQTRFARLGPDGQQRDKPMTAKQRDRIGKEPFSGTWRRGDERPLKTGRQLSE